MTARDRLVAIVVVAVMLLAGVWFLLVAPEHSKAGSLEGQIQTAQAALNSAESQVNGSSAAPSAYKRDFATLAYLGKAAPPDPAIASLIVEIQNASSHSQVNFQSIDQGSVSSAPTPAAPGTTTTTTTPATASDTTGAATGTPVGDSGLTTIPFQFTFSGTYFELAKLLKTLQGFTTFQHGKATVRGRLLVINSIGFAAGPKGFPQILATISATAFSLPAPQTLTPSATATSTPPAGSTATASATTTGSTPAATPATASVGSAG